MALGGKKNTGRRLNMASVGVVVHVRLTPEQADWLGASPAAALGKMVADAMAREATVGMPVARPKTGGGLCDRCIRLRLPGCQNCPKNRS